jgi:hypothetical protein
MTVLNVFGGQSIDIIANLSIRSHNDINCSSPANAGKRLFEPLVQTRRRSRWRRTGEIKEGLRLSAIPSNASTPRRKLFGKPSTTDGWRRLVYAGDDNPSICCSPKNWRSRSGHLGPYCTNTRWAAHGNMSAIIDGWYVDETRLEDRSGAGTGPAENSLHDLYLGCS